MHLSGMGQSEGEGRESKLQFLAFVKYEIMLKTRISCQKHNVHICPNSTEYLVDQLVYSISDYKLW